METQNRSTIRLTFADPEPEAPAGRFKFNRSVQHTGIHCVVCDVEKKADNHWFQFLADDEVLILTPLKGGLSEGFQAVCGEGHYDIVKVAWFAHRHAKGRHGS